MQSMTGFGRGEASEQGRTMIVELKSVNHRYLDLGMRLPRSLVFLEDCVRKTISSGLSRGHIDIFLNYQNQREDAKHVKVDEFLLQAYLEAGKQISTAANVPDDLNLSNLMELSDVLRIEEDEDDREAIKKLCTNATTAAITSLAAMRKAEGEAMKDDLLARITHLEDLVRMIDERAPLIVEEYRDKLHDRISNLLDSAMTPDQMRLANEVAVFADRANIDEELVRLKSHCEQMRQLCQSSEPCGRQFDFIIQEVNRELNTIGSKASDLSIANVVIEGKTEVEKMREQVQNIE